MKVPFKVMCINDKTLSGLPQAKWRIKFGERYEVIDTIETHWGIAYVLSIQPGVGYWPEQFATLPDVTADEMQDQEHEAIVNLETA